MGKDKAVNEKLGKAGGQALIEGIMMNGPGGAAIAVRRTDKKVIVRKKEFKHLKDKIKIVKIPIIRGIVGFVESMVLGYKCMMESVELSGALDIEMEEQEMSKSDKWLEEHLGNKMMGIVSGVAMVLGVLLSVFLFMWLPSFIFDNLDKYLAGGALLEHNLKALVEGLMRMSVFVLYIFIVSRMKEIKRTFMYHGAEHKTIFCYESGKDLTVENARSFKRFHPRCGTSFIFSIMIISVFISSALLALIPELKESRLLWVSVKLLITPFIMGLGYEFIKFAGKHDNVITRFFSLPGLWMQRLTTVEPTDDMLVIAIASLKAVVENENFDEKLLDEDGNPLPDGDEILAREKKEAEEKNKKSSKDEKDSK